MYLVSRAEQLHGASSERRPDLDPCDPDCQGCTNTGTCYAFVLPPACDAVLEWTVVTINIRCAQGFIASGPCLYLHGLLLRTQLPGRSLQANAIYGMMILLTVCQNTPNVISWVRSSRHPAGCHAHCLQRPNQPDMIRSAHMPLHTLSLLSIDDISPQQPHPITVLSVIGISACLVLECMLSYLDNPLQYVQPAARAAAFCKKYLQSVVGCDGGRPWCSETWSICSCQGWAR